MKKAVKRNLQIVCMRRDNASIACRAKRRAGTAKANQNEMCKKRINRKKSHPKNQAVKKAEPQKALRLRLP